MNQWIILNKVQWSKEIKQFLFMHRMCEAQAEAYIEY